MKHRPKGKSVGRIAQLSSKYRFTIPKEIREKLGIKAGQRFVMSDKNGSIVLTPVPDDPIEFLHGYYKGEPSMAEQLLEERARDLEHE